MSQFDFPRLHFSGSASINPATANNNVLLPLVCYNPVQVQALLPPRIYLSPDLQHLAKLGGLPLPEGYAIRADSPHLPYIPILPIDSPEKFRAWATTPLGNSPLDLAYHALYPLVKVKRTGKPLHGQVPANWNFYGGMEFSFQAVTVKSVAVPGQDGLQQLYEADTPGVPAEVSDWLGATLAMETDSGNCAAVMIDLLPSLAMYSQVFCDALRLRKGDGDLMKGKPKKGSLRFLNLNRIVNLEGAMAASGSFYSVIPLEAIEGEEEAPLIRFFREYGSKSKELKGIFVRYEVFEVQENLRPDYQSQGPAANPAWVTIAGTLSPWYAGDLASVTMGRQLVPAKPFHQDKLLPPLVCRLDPDRQVISLDMLGSIPETCTQDVPTAAYETYPLGLLRLKLLEANAAPTDLGRFRVDAAQLGRDQLLRTGGMVEVPFRKMPGITVEKLEAGLLALYGPRRTATGQEEGEELLLQEAEYMVASDQPGLYADQGQDPEGGYVSDVPRREQCQIRVFRRGKPFPGTLPMTIMELKITEAGATAAVNRFLDTPDFRDGQLLTLPTDQAANAMYVLYPEAPANISANLIPYLIQTGFFISLRVLPRQDYGRYLDPRHPDYPTPVTFDVLYREVLQVYELMYPVSALITPFTEAYFRKGARFIQSRMAPDNWGSATYMPSSRDLSGDQWALFCKWAEEISGLKPPTRF